MPLRSAVFLDRDGTLNRSAAPGQYVRRPEDLELLPGAAEAVRHINEAGVHAVLVTNQRWLSEPAADRRAYEAVDARLSALLMEHGARLTARYVCPHPLHSCDCRKPAAGMLVRAAADLGLDLAASCLIGDSATDVEAGRTAGSATVLIRPPGCGPHDTRADFVASDIREAVGWALGAGSGVRRGAVHR
ncbi:MULTISPECIES: D-glycero-alpha-D-manno-heptose-1,7-bisphosphate 7-phosphatase [Nocardiopsidaceae]|uniref:D,D-heptose 1,7-bisphosphate phosphatase n=2 Tax=Nocardiopsidaceae TaxID=83676 RepID=A0ABY6YPH3_9ACTN|nr:HAD-IIIA family hydrolase [Streptomonospora nanhaiensis]WAE74046.1 HAD-IIIA family hydrolase [Streptomonospora nanhaiensis]